MSSESLTKDQSVLGYTLKEHIGAGGYGEVWTAEAPGGLMKAIKFIYGFHDESRAQRELKSLNHIKQLRHPFLLSLERIDIDDGRLVIVTELADHCLSDRYDQCVEEGLGGIPRKELLSYMREAADALDYIGGAHSLQHLDIKPENILLLSGHVKVADFGLVKDIQDCTQSVMGGLTPAYAAPELFDGRPTKMSDQYSLAIVLQEMLTGERPFTGTTPAQLAAQHIHGRPNLRPLPRADQAAISKALAKNPDHRYPSCTAFVDEIIAGERSEKTSRKPTRVRKSRKKSDSDRDQTVVLGDLPTSRSSESVTKLPPIEFSPEDARIHPTLFVGVGGTGTRILRDIKERLTNRIGPMEQIPAFRFLAIDVDQDDLYAASRGRSSRGLSDVETFDIPLRRPDKYRNDDSLDLSWISRRWIYNIPRSRKTEGIRPLGRLAFVDNSDRLHDHLGKTIAPFRDESNVRLTAEKIGIPHSTKPRVFVVGAVSGGVGSGCIIDIAYSIRAAFAEIGHDEIEIVGVLPHGVGRTSSFRSLSAANTYAFLRELQHIRKNGYPGDDASGIPAFDEDTATFDSTYLVHMGEEGTDDAFLSKLSSLAAYVFLDSATTCNAANKVIRSSCPESEDRLRTFGLSIVDIAVESSANRLQRLLGEHLIKRWNSRSEVGFDDEATIRKLRASLQLSPSNILEISTSTVGEITGLNPFDLASEVAKNVGRGPLIEGNFSAVTQEIETSIQGWFHTENAGVNGDTVTERAHRSLSRLAKEKVKKLDSLVQVLADQPGFRVAKAYHSVLEFHRTLQDFTEATNRSLQENVAELRKIEEDWNSDALLESASIQESIDRYAHFKTRDEIIQIALRFIECLVEETELIQQRVDSISLTLKSIESTFPERRQNDQYFDDDFTYHFENHLIGEVASQAPKLVTELDDCLQQSYFDRAGGFWLMFSSDSNREVRSIGEAILRMARYLVRSAISQIDIDDVIRSRRIGDEELVEWIRPSVEDATPHILDCGGETRLVMNVPSMSSGELCSNALDFVFDESPTVVSGTRGSLTVCFEVQQIPIANIALRLIEDAPEAGECVARLVSRTDIDWGPLTGIA